MVICMLRLNAPILKMIALTATLGFAFIFGKQMQSDQVDTVFLNMKEAIHQPIKAFASKLSEKQQAQFIKLYNKALTQTISDYALAHRVNIVTATTIYDYSGVDVTQEIINANLKAVEQNTKGEANAKV